jgi:hypothetical protein
MNKSQIAVSRQPEILVHPAVSAISGMDSFTIVCPNCKSQIPLSEAVTHQVHEQLAGDFRRREQLLQKSLAERERQIVDQQTQIENKCPLRTNNESRTGLIFGLHGVRGVEPSSVKNCLAFGPRGDLLLGRFVLGLATSPRD